MQLDPRSCLEQYTWHDNFFERFAPLRIFCFSQSFRNHPNNALLCASNLMISASPHPWCCLGETFIQWTAIGWHRSLLKKNCYSIYTTLLIYVFNFNTYSLVKTETLTKRYITINNRVLRLFINSLILLVHCLQTCIGKLLSLAYLCCTIARLCMYLLYILLLFHSNNKLCNFIGR